MKLYPIRRLLFLMAVPLLTAVEAVDWTKLDVLSDIKEVGQLSDVAVDDAGRVHVVTVSDVGTGTLFWYKMRPNASTGFTEPDSRTLIDSRPAGADPRCVSIGVTDDFTVQAVMVDDTGSVVVYELPSGGSGAASWNKTEIATNGWGDSRTGVSIESRGDNGFPSSAIAFTRKEDAGVASDGAALHTQGTSGAWSFSRNILTGKNTGMGARLINVTTANLASAQRVLATYNATTRRMVVTRERQLAGGISTTVWNSQELSDQDAPSYSRPGGDAGPRGEVGISFVPSFNDGIYYYSLDGTVWSGSRITGNDERAGDGDSFGGFNKNTAVAMDADGQPWVAYGRVAGGSAEDIRARRHLPGTGWLLDIVETFDSPAAGNVGSIALATGANGDPALVYERDRGATQSDCVFARPRPAPWVAGRPEALDNIRDSFAPALAASAGGGFHLVTSTSTGGGFGFPPPPRVFQKRRLLTYSGGSVTDLEIPGTANPYVANAVTETPDGTVHIISLRLANSGSTSGDLVYYRGPVGGPIVGAPGALVAGDDSDAAVATGPVILESDAAGNLYAAYLKAGGGVEIRFRGPDPGEWETLATLSASSIRGIDLAVSPQGRVCLSYYDPARSGTGTNGAQIRLFANFSPKTGLRTPGFVDYNAYFLAISDGEPKNVSCVILREGSPRIAFALRGSLNYLKPRLVGFTGFTASTPASGFAGATVNLLARGNRVHLLAFDERDGGVFRYLELEDAAPVTVKTDETFLTPGYPLTGPGQTALAGCLDQSGAPVLAGGVLSGSGFLIGLDTNHVILARPADALDGDGDQIPLLAESAHCLDRFAETPLSLMPAGRTSRRFGGDVALEFSFRAPAIPSTRSETGVQQYGEFTYRYEAGSDLQGWALEEEIGGRISTILYVQGITPPAKFRVRTTGFLYDALQVRSDPRRFSRLSLGRDR